MSSRSIHTSRYYRVKVGITLGDPSGVGADIILPAINRLKGKADFTVIGDGWILNKLKALSQESNALRIIDLNNVSHNDFSFGKIKAEYGKASIQYLDKALALIKNKEIDCLVTCPISKEAINLAGFNFRGHTEYLAKKTNTKDFVMLLLNNELKISLLTRHMPLEDVPRAINAGMIYKNILLTNNALKKLFLIKAPNIAVCGLNPHASDNGVIGKQEIEIIKPALERLKVKLRNITGPLSADVAIYKAKKGLYDAVIAMYHDQALIPLKLSGRETAVNMTLGLPFIRTSPLHGTAFDIAGKAKADPSSLVEAIKLAVRCTQNLRKV